MIHTTATTLHAAILAAAAADCPEPHTLPAGVHVPIRPQLFVEFAYCIDGVRGRFKVMQTPMRLEYLAEAVRKKWALFGGGPKPAPAAPKASTGPRWSAALLKLWVELNETRDHAAALQLGRDRLGARCYVRPNGTTFAAAAPQPVEGLPEEFASVRTDCGNYAVIHLPTGAGIRTGYSMRKDAAAYALADWQRATPEQRAQGLAKATAGGWTTGAAAEAEWARAHGLAVEEAMQDTTAPEPGQALASVAPAAVATPQAPPLAPIEPHHAKQALQMANPLDAGQSQRPRRARVGACRPLYAIAHRRTATWRRLRAGAGDPGYPAEEARPTQYARHAGPPSARGYRAPPRIPRGAPVMLGSWFSPPALALPWHDGRRPAPLRYPPPSLQPSPVVLAEVRADGPPRAAGRLRSAAADWMQRARCGSASPWPPWHAWPGGPPVAPTAERPPPVAEFLGLPPVAEFLEPCARRARPETSA